MSYTIKLVGGRGDGRILVIPELWAMFEYTANSSEPARNRDIYELVPSGFEGKSDEYMYKLCGMGLTLNSKEGTNHETRMPELPPLARSG